ncbi:MAG TPA: lysophospholipid acyltransferase family protein, partial [Solirubrobacterales bacterium]|nr:lysophospholipid acyltransferase family protein [Solirubrobacterales bacterium]
SGFPGQERFQVNRPAAPTPEAVLEWAGTVQSTSDLILRRLAGEYHEDAWGFDEEFTEAVFPLFEFLYSTWWRVQVEGAANVPGHGRALLVANHSGAIFPFDGAMIATAIQKEHPLPRWVKAMVLNWAFDLPFVSYILRRLGGVAANPANLGRLLEEDQPVMVFPEGQKGFGKSFADRYRLQRFGRGGFVEVALETGSPIVPVAVVGAEEIYPKLGESKPLARAIGSPYVPVTPTFPWLGPLGLLPLPSRWRIEFLEPIDLSGYGPGSSEDRSLVFDLSEQVREQIQEALYRGLVKRGPAFL